MASGDLRRIPQVASDKNGYASAFAINEQLRVLAEMIYQLEGRRGEAALRDRLKVEVNSKISPLLIQGAQLGNFSVSFGGIENSSTYLAKGANMLSSGMWQALDTTALIQEFSRLGELRVYLNQGLQVGQSFIPTLYGKALLINAAGTSPILQRTGACVPSPQGGKYYNVFRAPLAGTISKIYALRNGGTGATVNVRKNGATNILGSSFSLSSTDTWMEISGLTNTTLAIGDRLEIYIDTVTGTLNHISIQIEITPSA